MSKLLFILAMICTQPMWAQIDCNRILIDGRPLSNCTAPVVVPPPVVVPTFTTWYVDSTLGRDANPCLRIAPCQFLQRAVNLAQPGDLILVRNGTYPAPANCTIIPNSVMAVTINTAGTALKPITLQAETKGGVILDGQNVCHSYINFGSNADYWIIDGFKLTRTRWGGVWSNSNAKLHTTFKNGEISNVGNRSELEGCPNTCTGIAGIYTDQSAILTVADSSIHDIGRTNDAGNAFDHGIYSHGNVTVTGTHFYNLLSGWAIQTASGASFTIDHNTFTGPVLYRGSQKDGQIMLWNNNPAISITNNTFDHPRNTAFDSVGFSSTNCKVSSNTVIGATIGSVTGCVFSGTVLQ